MKGACLVVTVTLVVLAGCKARSDGGEAPANLIRLHNQMRICGVDGCSTDLYLLNGYTPSNLFVPDAALRRLPTHGGLALNRPADDPPAPGNAPRFLYGFCAPFPAPGRGWMVGDAHPNRMNTAVPELARLGGYSIEHTARLGDPCARLADLGLDPDRFTVFNGQHFEAFALGDPDEDGELEVWSVRHDTEYELRQLR